mgnify:CR=1 FL=1
MTVQREPMHAGEFLLSEGTGNISREAINVAAGPALEPGQILGLVTATGQFAPYNRPQKMAARTLRPSSTAHWASRM